MKRILCTVSFAACTLIAAAAPADAQRSARSQSAALNTELSLIRQATMHESAGNYAEAERVIGEVLDENPLSLSGLLALERILIAQNRVAEIMPAVERLLREDRFSVIGHQLRLRVASLTDDVQGIESAGAEWIRAVPHLETPYREVAVVWRARREHARAIAVLEQGRRRIDRPDALALELGDAYQEMSQFERAAEEWSRAVGDDGRGFMLVQRRLQALPDGGAGVIPQLVARLAEGTASYARLRAAVMLAIDAGLDDHVARLLPNLAASAPDAERETLLVEIARRADGAGLHAVALAAYRQLLVAAAGESSALAIRSRVAELALLAGDTALAARTYRELEQAAAAGSPQRRQAVALRIQLTAREGDLEAAIEDLQAFRTEFPQASELDETAAALAERLLAGGRSGQAERVLSGVHGPRSARARGRLYLQLGDIPRAREELLGAAPHLRGREATETIALASLLSRLSPRGAELLTAFSSADPAARIDSLRATAAAARSLAAAERAAVLDFLAGAADAAAAAEDAAALRREIVEELPRMQEAPAALLALARHNAVSDPTSDEARVLLEKLIVEYPRSALAPQARTELQRLQAR
jgi:hypothetical protein